MSLIVALKNEYPKAINSVKYLFKIRGYARELEENSPCTSTYSIQTPGTGSAY